MTNPQSALEGGFLLLLAPVVGSFLGVVIRRFPAGHPLVWSRSRCEACGAVLSVRDLIPLFSWIRSRGHCRHCGIFLGWFYPAIEIAALAIAALALAANGLPGAWFDCLFGWYLLVLACIDLHHWVLPDQLTLPLIAAGLIAAALYDPADWTDRALGAALGYAVLRAIAGVYRLIRKREGLGVGDAKLLSAAGAWVGAIALPQVILGAALAALAGATVLRFRGVRLHAYSALPFGPFIALATWGIWLFGPVSA
jgi:leader peptidase (prepilin peptidase) / N-methyltransferase